MSGSQYDQTGFCIQRGSTKARKDAAFAIPGKPVPVLKEACRIMSSGGIMAACLVFCCWWFPQQGKPIGDSLLRSIVGGEEALVGELPFVAKILYGGSRVGCTGSLIAPDKVLTAGHCVSGYCLWGSGTPARATLCLRHDIAPRILHTSHILQLEAAVTSIQPVHVLTLEEELRYAPSGGLGTAVGWGGTQRAIERVGARQVAVGCPGRCKQ